MKKFLFAALLTAVLAGCVIHDDSIDADTIMSESLIDHYYLATSSNPIRILFNDGAPIGGGGCYLYIDKSGAKLASLLEMKQRYDDTHYNSYIHHPGMYAVYANEFSSLNLVSDTDFNNIKAGESLGGIVRLHALSPYRWLMSGSKVTFDWKQFDDATFWPSKIDLPIGQLYPVNAFLKDLTPDDLKLLLLNYTLLYFCELPAIKTHTLTLTFYEKDTTISSSTRVVFQ